MGKIASKAVMKKKETLRLKELLQELRGSSSIREFCKDLNLSYASWTAWEARRAFPTLQKLEVIAKLLDWNVVQLLVYLKTGNKENPPYSVDELLKYGKALSWEERQLLATRLLEDE